MRYDRKIDLVYERPGGYDPDTGNIAESVRTSRTVSAAILPLTEERQREIYNGLKADSLEVHIQVKPTRPYNLICIDGVDYTIDSRTYLRFKATFIISRGG